MLLQHSGCSSSPTANLLAGRLIQFVWTSVHHLWLLRNEHVHRLVPNVGSARERDKLHQSIRKLYQLAEQCNAADRDLFSVPLKEQLQRPNSSHRYWLRTFSQPIRTAVRDASFRLRHQCQDIRRFFRPVRRHCSSQSATTGDQNHPS